MVCKCLPAPRCLAPAPSVPVPSSPACLCRNKLIRKSAALDSSLWASLGGRERGTRVHIQILYRRRATFEQFIFQSPKLILAGHRRVNVGTPHGALRHWQPCTHPFPTRTSLPSSQHQPRCVLSSSPPFLCMPPTCLHCHTKTCHGGLNMPGVVHLTDYYKGNQPCGPSLDLD